MVLCFEFPLNPLKLFLPRGTDTKKRAEPFWKFTLLGVNFQNGEAMTVFYMRFPGQFSQIGFSCYLVWKHSKNTHWTHFWACWAFFSENQPNVMNFGFFCPFGKICCWCALQITTNTLGLFEKGVQRWTSWKFCFFSIFDLFFYLFWRFFCYFKKIWEGPSEKIISGQNLIFHIQKLIWKSKNIPTLLKKPRQKVVWKFFLTFPEFQLGFLNKVGIFFGFQINFCMWKIRFWP